MTRYLVFAGDDHYPIGGAADFVGVYENSITAALGMAHSHDWAHVAELTDNGLVIVAERREGRITFYPERIARPSTIVIDAIRISYTVDRSRPGSLWYHGAIRRRHNDGVIWECSHDHDLVWPARQCADTEIKDRAARASDELARGEETT